MRKSKKLYDFEDLVEDLLVEAERAKVVRNFSEPPSRFYKETWAKLREQR